MPGPQSDSYFQDAVDVARYKLEPRDDPLWFKEWDGIPAAYILIYR